jgi:23S rRNA pseudouridine1911/1915/1917 synthase
LRFRVSSRSDARSARTHFRRLALREAAASCVGAAVSWLACRLDTGRTHQIRVHLESIGHPLLGDPLYSRRRPSVSGPALSLSRQALHACRLSLVHPASARPLTWFHPPAPDIIALMSAMGWDADTGAATDTDAMFRPPATSARR